MSNENDFREERECRICHMPESLDLGPLYHPCKCKGSIGYVHGSCLSNWLKVKTNNHQGCELCKHEFKFIKVFPSSWQLFRTFLNFLFSQRYVSKLLLWFILFPYLVEKSFEGLYYFSISLPVSVNADFRNVANLPWGNRFGVLHIAPTLQLPVLFSTTIKVFRDIQYGMGLILGLFLLVVVFCFFWQIYKKDVADASLDIKLDRVQHYLSEHIQNLQFTERKSNSDDEKKIEIPVEHPGNAQVEIEEDENVHDFATWFGLHENQSIYQTFARVIFANLILLCCLGVVFWVPLVTGRIALSVARPIVESVVSNYSSMVDIIWLMLIGWRYHSSSPVMRDMWVTEYKKKNYLYNSYSQQQEHFHDLIHESPNIHLHYAEFDAISSSPFLINDKNPLGSISSIDWVDYFASFWAPFTIGVDTTSFREAAAKKTPNQASLYSSSIFSFFSFSSTLKLYRMFPTARQLSLYLLAWTYIYQTEGFSYSNFLARNNFSVAEEKEIRRRNFLQALLLKNQRQTKNHSFTNSSSIHFVDLQHFPQEEQQAAQLALQQVQQKEQLFSSFLSDYNNTNKKKEENSCLSFDPKSVFLFPSSLTPFNVDLFLDSILPLTFNYSLSPSLSSTPSEVFESSSFAFVSHFFPLTFHHVFYKEQILKYNSSISSFLSPSNPSSLSSFASFLSFHDCFYLTDVFVWFFGCCFVFVSLVGFCCFSSWFRFFPREKRAQLKEELNQLDQEEERENLQHQDVEARRRIFARIDRRMELSLLYLVVSVEFILHEFLDQLFEFIIYSISFCFFHILGPFFFGFSSSFLINWTIFQDASSSSTSSFSSPFLYDLQKNFFLCCAFFFFFGRFSWNTFNWLFTFLANISLYSPLKLAPFPFSLLTTFSSWFLRMKLRIRLIQTMKEKSELFVFLIQLFVLLGVGTILVCVYFLIPLVCVQRLCTSFSYVSNAIFSLFYETQSLAVSSSNDEFHSLFFEFFSFFVFSLNICSHFFKKWFNIGGNTTSLYRWFFDLICRFFQVDSSLAHSSFRRSRVVFVWLFFWCFHILCLCCFIFLPYYVGQIVLFILQNLNFVQTPPHYIPWSAIVVASWFLGFFLLYPGFISMRPGEKAPVFQDEKENRLKRVQELQRQLEQLRNQVKEEEEEKRVEMKDEKEQYIEAKTKEDQCSSISFTCKFIFYFIMGVQILLLIILTIFLLLSMLIFLRFWFYIPMFAAGVTNFGWPCLFAVFFLGSFLILYLQDMKQDDGVEDPIAPFVFAFITNKFQVEIFPFRWFIRAVMRPILYNQIKSYTITFSILVIGVFYFYGIENVRNNVTLEMFWQFLTMIFSITRIEASALNKMNPFLHLPFLGFAFLLSLGVTVMPKLLCQLLKDMKVFLIQRYEEENTIQRVFLNIDENE